MSGFYVLSHFLLNPSTFIQESIENSERVVCLHISTRCQNPINIHRLFDNVHDSVKYIVNFVCIAFCNPQQCQLNRAGKYICWPGFEPSLKPMLPADHN